jgi:hypothetical protein
VTLFTLAWTHLDEAGRDNQCSSCCTSLLYWPSVPHIIKVVALSIRKTIRVRGLRVSSFGGAHSLGTA